MKYILRFLFSAFLLFPATKILLPASCAQASGWIWGRGNTGAGIDAYVVTTDGSGNVYGGGFNYENTPAIFGAITLPNSATTGTAGGTGFSQPVWVKYNSAGTALWADGTQNGDAWLYNITTDPSGDLIVFGSFETPTIQIGGTILTNAYGTSGDNQYFIAKYNPTGTLLWAICDGNAPNTYHYFLGFVAIISTGGVTTDASGNIYITSSFQDASITIGGHTLTNADPSGTTGDIFVAKYTPAGTLVWATRAGGASDDFAYGITVVPSGNVYITGPFWSPSITFGSSVIANPYGTGGYGGGTTFGGGTPIAYIAEFSPAGAPLWGQAAGGSNGAYSMGLVSDLSGNVYMTGGFGDVSIGFGGVTVNRTYPAAAPNLAQYLVQYSPANVVTWSKTIGSPTQGLWGFAIGLAACGEVWVSGNYSEAASIDGNTLALVAGSDPVFIAGYNLAGGVIGYSGLGSGGDDQNGIAVDPSGNVYMCSDYEDLGAGSFSIGPDVLPTTGTGNEYFYLGKYSNIVGVPDTDYSHSDTTLCNASGITLSAPLGYSGYTWNNASALSTQSVTVSGTYWVLCTSTCSVPVLIDTFHVTITAGGNTFNSSNVVTCGSTAVNVNGDPGYTSYAWSTGNTTSAISSDTGTVWVTELNGCGSRSDTFHITLAPPIIVTATPKMQNCSSSINFSCTPVGGGYAYQWNGPSGFASVLPYPSIATATAANQGVYTVTVTDNATGCSGQTTTTVTVGPAVVLHLTNITPTQIINYGSSVQLNADNATYYRWMPNDGTLNNRNINNPVATPTQNTTYTVYGMDSTGCMDSANIIVDIIFDTIAIPSAFTPNGDGLNDIFHPLNMKYQKLLEFSIYNRWGQRIFTTSNKNQGWDGTFNGVPQDMDVYEYVLIVELDNGDNKFFKGDVTLIR